MLSSASSSSTKKFERVSDSSSLSVSFSSTSFPTFTESLSSSSMDPGSPLSSSLMDSGSPLSSSSLDFSSSSHSVSDTADTDSAAVSSLTSNSPFSFS